MTLDEFIGDFTREANKVLDTPEKRDNLTGDDLTTIENVFDTVLEEATQVIEEGEDEDDEDEDGTAPTN